MSRRTLRRSLVAVCTAVFAAGLLGISAGGSAGAGVPRPSVPASAPPAGGGVEITVLPVPAAGWVSFT